MDTLNQLCSLLNIVIGEGARLPLVLPFTRDDLASWFGALGFKQGAEIGVEQGRFSEVLCKAIPGLHLLCVDAWARYSNYRDHVNQDKLDNFYRITEERLKKYDAVLCRGYSQDVAPHVKDGSLDFVYIDANHTLPFVVQDLALWSAKVRKGGIVAGHDFQRRKPEAYGCHVIEAVQAWTSAYKVRPWFLLGDGDSKHNHSYFWVKQ